MLYRRVHLPPDRSLESDEHFGWWQNLPCSAMTDCGKAFHLCGVRLNKRINTADSIKRIAAMLIKVNMAKASIITRHIEKLKPKPAMSYHPANNA